MCPGCATSGCALCVLQPLPTELQLWQMQCLDLKLNFADVFYLFFLNNKLKWFKIIEINFKRMFSVVSQLRRAGAAPAAGDPHRFHFQPCPAQCGLPLVQNSPHLSEAWLMHFSVMTPKGDKKEGKGHDDNFWIKTEKESQGKPVLRALQEPLPRCEAGSVLTSQDIAHHGGLGFA